MNKAFETRAITDMLTANIQAALEIKNIKDQIEILKAKEDQQRALIKNNIDTSYYLLADGSENYLYENLVTISCRAVDMILNP